MFPAVCASQVHEPLFFFNQKNKIDCIGWERHAQWCMFPVTGFFLLRSAFPKGQVKTSTWGVVDIAYC